MSAIAQSVEQPVVPVDSQHAIKVRVDASITALLEKAEYFWPELTTEEKVAYSEWYLNLVGLRDQLETPEEKAAAWQEFQGRDRDAPQPALVAFLREAGPHQRKRSLFVAKQIADGHAKA